MKYALHNEFCRQENPNELSLGFKYPIRIAIAFQNDSLIIKLKCRKCKKSNVNIPVSILDQLGKEAVSYSFWCNLNSLFNRCSLLQEISGVLSGYYCYLRGSSQKKGFRQQI